MHVFHLLRQLLLGSHVSPWGSWKLVGVRLNREEAGEVEVIGGLEAP